MLFDSIMLSDNMLSDNMLSDYSFSCDYFIDYIGSQQLYGMLYFDLIFFCIYGIWKYGNPTGLVQYPIGRIDTQHSAKLITDIASFSPGIASYLAKLLP
jgi:hypothetical protein